MGGAETLETQGRQNSRERFAERFAGKFPEFRRTKLKISPRIRSAGPRHQPFMKTTEITKATKTTKATHTATNKELSVDS